MKRFLKKAAAIGGVGAILFAAAVLPNNPVNSAASTVSPIAAASAHVGHMESVCKKDDNGVIIKEGADTSANWSSFPEGDNEASLKIGDTTLTVDWTGSSHSEPLDLAPGSYHAHSDWTADGGGSFDEDFDVPTCHLPVAPEFKLDASARCNPDDLNGIKFLVDGTTSGFPEGDAVNFDAVRDGNTLGNGTAARNTSFEFEGRVDSGDAYGPQTGDFPMVVSVFVADKAVATAKVNVDFSQCQPKHAKAPVLNVEYKCLADGVTATYPLAIKVSGKHGEVTVDGTAIDLGKDGTWSSKVSNVAHVIVVNYTDGDFGPATVTQTTKPVADCTPTHVAPPVLNVEYSCVVKGVTPTYPLTITVAGKFELVTLDGTAITLGDDGTWTGEVSNSDHVVVVNYNDGPYGVASVTKSSSAVADCTPPHVVVPVLSVTYTCSAVDSVATFPLGIHVEGVYAQVTVDNIGVILDGNGNAVVDGLANTVHTVVVEYEDGAYGTASITQTVQPVEDCTPPVATPVLQTFEISASCVVENGIGVDRLHIFGWTGHFVWYTTVDGAPISDKDAVEFDSDVVVNGGYIDRGTGLSMVAVAKTHSDADCTPATPVSVPPIPATGSGFTIPGGIGGMALALGGTILVLITRRRRPRLA